MNTKEASANRLDRVKGTTRSEQKLGKLGKREKVCARINHKLLSGWRCQMASKLRIGNIAGPVSDFGNIWWCVFFEETKLVDGARVEMSGTVEIGRSVAFFAWKWECTDDFDVGGTNKSVWTLVNGDHSAYWPISSRRICSDDEDQISDGEISTFTQPLPALDPIGNIFA